MATVYISTVDIIKAIENIDSLEFVKYTNGEGEACETLRKGKDSYENAKPVGKTKEGRDIYSDNTVKVFGKKRTPLHIHSKINEISDMDSVEGDNGIAKIMEKHGVNEGYDTEHQLHNKYHSGEMTEKHLNKLHSDLSKYWTDNKMQKSIESDIYDDMLEKGKTDKYFGYAKTKEGKRLLNDKEKTDKEFQKHDERHNMLESDRYEKFNKHLSDKIRKLAKENPESEHAKFVNEYDKSEEKRGFKPGSREIDYASAERHLTKHGWDQEELRNEHEKDFKYPKEEELEESRKKHEQLEKLEIENDKKFGESYKEHLRGRIKELSEKHVGEDKNPHEKLLKDKYNSNSIYHMEEHLKKHLPKDEIKSSLPEGKHPDKSLRYEKLNRDFQISEKMPDASKNQTKQVHEFYNKHLGTGEHVKHADEQHESGLNYDNDLSAAKDHLDKYGTHLGTLKHKMGGGTVEHNAYQDKDGKKFIHSSSQDVYGTPNNEWVTKPHDQLKKSIEDDDLEKGDNAKKLDKDIDKPFHVYYTKRDKRYIPGTVMHPKYGAFNSGHDTLEEAKKESRLSNTLNNNGVSRRSDRPDHSCEFHYKENDGYFNKLQKGIDDSEIYDDMLEKAEKSTIGRTFNHVADHGEFHNGAFENGYDKTRADFHEKHTGGNNFKLANEETHDIPKLVDKLKKEGAIVETKKGKDGAVHTAYNHKGTIYAHSTPAKDSNDQEFVTTKDSSVKKEKEPEMPKEEKKFHDDIDKKHFNKMRYTSGSFSQNHDYIKNKVKELKKNGENLGAFKNNDGSVHNVYKHVVGDTVSKYTHEKHPNGKEYLSSDDYESKIQKSVESDIYDDMLEKGEISDKLSSSYGGGEPIKFTKTGKEIKQLIPSALTRLEAEKTLLETNMAEQKALITVNANDLCHTNIPNVKVGRFSYDVSEPKWDGGMRQQPTEEQVAMQKYNVYAGFLVKIIEDIKTLKVIQNNVEEGKQYTLICSQLIAITDGE